MGAIAIQIAHADGRQEKRPLNEGSYHVGREGTEILLPDPDVSARHARLDVRGGAVSITDLGSTNGTRDASGTRIAVPHLLRPNQPIRLGRSTISVVAPGGPRTRVMPQFVQPTSPGAPPAPPPARVQRKLSLFANATRTSRGVVLSEDAWITNHTTTTTTYDDYGVRSRSHHVTSHHWQRIWYRLDSGAEVSRTYCDARVAVRQGHRIAVINDAATNETLRFVNCATRYYWYIGIPTQSVVRRFFNRVGWVIGASFLACPLLNLCSAVAWLRQAFGRSGRWYSGVVLKLLVTAFCLAVLGSYAWAFPLLALASPEASHFVVSAEAAAQLEKLLAHVVASDLFASLAPLSGAKQADIAGLIRGAHLELRDAGWLTEQAFITKYRIQPIALGSERFITHIGVPLSALCSFLVFALGTALYQFKLTMHYWFARALDKQSNAEM